MLAYLYKNWAFMGVGIAFYVTLLLASSFYDLSYFIFLVWLQFPVYLLHQCEEHGYPGGFQEFINLRIFKTGNTNSPFNPARIFWINIGIIWGLFPLFAVLAQCVNPVYGVFLPIFGLFNATTHIMSGIAKKGYDPGLGISLFLNYPTGIFTLYVAHKLGYLTKLSVGGSVLFSFLLHVMMFAMALY